MTIYICMILINNTKMLEVKIWTISFKKEVFPLWTKFKKYYRYCVLIKNVFLFSVAVWRRRLNTSDVNWSAPATLTETSPTRRNTSFEICLDVFFWRLLIIRNFIRFKGKVTWDLFVYGFYWSFPNRSLISWSKNFQYHLLWLPFFKITYAGSPTTLQSSVADPDLHGSAFKSTSGS